MNISEKILTATNRRGAFAKAASPTAVAVRYDRRSARLVISLSPGIDISFSPKQAQGLEAAQAPDLADAQISPSGLGVHFPKLDADLYIPALLEGFLGSRLWMAAQNGGAGGNASSAAKAVAARAKACLSQHVLGGGAFNQLSAKPCVTGTAVTPWSLRLTTLALALSLSACGLETAATAAAAAKLQAQQAQVAQQQLDAARHQLEQANAQLDARKQQMDAAAQ